MSVTTPRRIIAAALVGTSVEFYDFYLYATASALVFGPVFFPEVSPAAAVMASFASYGVGFLARPLGGIVAGHLGDRWGRARLLVYSLVLMGIASTLIGLLPGYATAGTAAVIALVALRLVQGLAAGAEWAGAALLAVEHAAPHRRGLFGSATQSGSAVGMLAATGAFAGTRAILGPETFLAWGWRLPFLLSAVLVAVGVLIRRGVAESPEFTRSRDRGTLRPYPVLAALRGHGRALLVTAGLRLVQPAVYSILTVYAVNYLAQRRDDSELGLAAVLIASAVSLVTTPLWGALADRWGARRIAIAAASGMIIGIWPYFALLDSGPLALVIPATLIGMNLLHDAIYGPQAGWFARQFPAEVRYSGSSLGYQIGSVISVGLTPLLAAWLVQLDDGAPWLVCGYIGLLGLLGLLTIWAATAARALTTPAQRDAPGTVPAGVPA